MIPQEIIRRKRDGQALAASEIASFVEGFTQNDITEGQVAAFAMAVFLQGMSDDETVALTLAMRDSGTVLKWDGVGRPVADKHSTGGVGDNVSLMLAPIVAACGLAVPMISGRGLGHTGGTLDKLQSIPGYNVMPDQRLFRRVVEQVGCAIIGQTADLAPADRRLYAIRDVTATVESAPLITASILSKKLAAGLGSLLLDVKVGNGAFMDSWQEAETLARSLVKVANGAGLPTVALMTDMNQPLADSAGNALEVSNCVDFLSGLKAGTRLEAVVMAEAAEMLVQSGLFPDLRQAEENARMAVSSGEAMERFSKMVHALGGPADFCDRPSAHLKAAAVRVPVRAPRSGYLVSCRTRALGMAVVELGGGRRKVSDSIDHSVGIGELLPLGEEVGEGDPIAVVHAGSEANAARAAAEIVNCFVIGDAPPPSSPVIIGRIG